MSASSGWLARRSPGEGGRVLSCRFGWQANHLLLRVRLLDFAIVRFQISDEIFRDPADRAPNRARDRRRTEVHIALRRREILEKNGA